MFEELTLGNRRGTIRNRRQDQHQVGGKWEVPLIIIFILKAPKLAEDLAFFSPERTKAVVKGRFRRKKQAWTGTSQRES